MRIREASIKFPWKNKEGLIFTLLFRARSVEIRKSFLRTPITAAVLPYGLLKKTSRSFYLSLRILPGGMRTPVALAYLLARAADTVADTEAVPASMRLQLLRDFHKTLGNSWDETLADVKTDIAPHVKFAERELIEALPFMPGWLNALEKNDRDAVRKVLDTLLSGMEFDLETFPAEDSGNARALASMEDLDRYTYLVAGCVGEFWTDMMLSHVHGLHKANREERVRLGIRFGKALQMTNILRDCAQDVRIGRCYLPQPLLERCNLTAHQLLQPRRAADARPALHHLARLTLQHFRAAIDYTVAIPPRHRRLRLACLWPIVIGLETLRAHIGNANWLDPSHPSKITRAKVYRILLASLPKAGSDKAIRRWTEELIDRIEKLLLPPID